MSLIDDITDAEERSAGWLAPGSDEAIQAGCACPILDNGHGRGLPGPDGPLYWYTDDCPVHFPKPTTVHGRPATADSATESGS